MIYFVWLKTIDLPGPFPQDYPRGLGGGCGLLKKEKLMSATREQKLIAKVKAVNKANDYANQLYVQLVAIFQPLVGQQILKVHGDLLLKIEKMLPVFKNSNGLRVYRSRSDYSLIWTVNANERECPDGGTQYHEVSVYVGKLDHGTLTDVYDSGPGGRRDYTPEEVKDKRETYKAAKEIADKANSALHPFGEYER